MTILSDHPILRPLGSEPRGMRAADDAFGLSSRLGAVYDIIRHKNTRAPMAIGILGDWGTGKTSAMRWLSEQLSAWSRPDVQRFGHCRCRCVWFEPWKYQTREDVWKGLIAEVILSACDLERANRKTRTLAARQFGGFLGRSFLHALESCELKAGIPGLGSIGIGASTVRSILREWGDMTHPERAFLNVFEDRLRAWVARQLGDDERMVIFIDDLDRCLPGVVLEVLEALKLYLNLPHLIFVLGVDRSVVQAIVRKHYAEAGLSSVKADSYLDKMFQVEVSIAPSEGSMDGYFSRQIGLLNDTTDGAWTKTLEKAGDHRFESCPPFHTIIESAIRSLARHNPREVKRLLNSTLMRGMAAERLGTLPGDPALRFAQGCQAYLLARFLRDEYEGSEELLRQRRAWEFFALWSQFIRDFPQADVTTLERRYEDASAAEPTGSGVDQTAPGSAIPPEHVDRYDALRRVMPLGNRASSARTSLIHESFLWDLLRIPCSVEVGQLIAPPREREQESRKTASRKARLEKKKRRGTELDETNFDQLLHAAPEEFRFVLAACAGVDPDEVRIEHIARIKHLDLVGVPFKDKHLFLLANPALGLGQLESLRLGGTQLTDLGIKSMASRPGAFPMLKKLYLTGTSVSLAGMQAIAQRIPGLEVER